MKRRIVVKGPRVQDVGYRALMLELAHSLRIPGFGARKLPRSGHVEALVRGPEEDVEELIDLLKERRPEGAEVTEIEAEDFDEEVEETQKFTEAFSVYQVPKIVSIGRKMLNNQDQMLDNQDETVSVIREEHEKTRGVFKDHVTRDVENLRQEVRDLRKLVESKM